MSLIESWRAILPNGVPRGGERAILLGTDYDNEGKPIAYLAKQADGKLKFAGTAFLTISGAARDELQDRIARLPSVKAPANIPKVRRATELPSGG